MIRILYIIFISVLSSPLVMAKSKDTTITILQTADLHAYLNKHNELFIEKGKLKFREAGGLAHIKTLVDGVHKENQNGKTQLIGKYEKPARKNENKIKPRSRSTRLDHRICKVG